MNESKPATEFCEGLPVTSQRIQRPEIVFTNTPLDDPLMWMSQAKTIMIALCDIMYKTTFPAPQYRDQIEELTLEVKHWINQCSEKGWIK